MGISVLTVYLIEFLLSFNYQLSGEVAFHVDLLKKMRFATNWGVEVFTLIEVYRKASSAAQVMFSKDPFDHKHQDASPTDPATGRRPGFNADPVCGPFYAGGLCKSGKPDVRPWSGGNAGGAGDRQ